MSNPVSNYRFYQTLDWPEKLAQTANYLGQHCICAEQPRDGMFIGVWAAVAPLVSLSFLSPAALSLPPC